MLPPTSPMKSQIAKFQIENSNKEYNQLIVNKNIGLKSTEWSGGWDGTIWFWQIFYTGSSQQIWFQFLAGVNNQSEVQSFFTAFSIVCTSCVHCLLLPLPVALCNLTYFCPLYFCYLHLQCNKLCICGGELIAPNLQSPSAINFRGETKSTHCFLTPFLTLRMPLAINSVR